MYLGTCIHSFCCLVFFLSNQRRVFETVVAKLLPIALRWRAHASQCRASLAHHQQGVAGRNSHASYTAAMHAAPEFWPLVGETTRHADAFIASLDAALAATLFHADHMIDTGLPWLPPAPASASASSSSSSSTAESASGKKSAATAAAKANKATTSDHDDGASAFADAASSSSSSLDSAGGGSGAHDGVYQRLLFAQLNAIAAAASSTDAAFAAHITEVWFVDALVPMRRNRV